jgi:hypothetical protein
MSEPMDLDAKLSLRGKFPGGGTGHGPRTSAAGRTCAEGSCTTVLSVYNTGDHCWEHTPRTPYLLNVRRFRPARKQSA